MYDIITFGSATKDIFIKPKTFQKISDKKKFITGKGVCFNLGSKVDIKDITFSSGGGGTNTAATFAKQGFRVAYCGAVGNDLAGQEIINELANRGIDTQFIIKTDRKSTNHSIVISGIDDERTILVYRGASEELKAENIPWLRVSPRTAGTDPEAKWFYIAPLSGSLCDRFEALVNFAYKNKIKVALNPGNCQLSLPQSILKRILNKVDILILNQEEAALLTKIPYSKEKEIFKKIDEICSGITIMTKGERGVVVSDGQYLYRAKPRKSKVVDRTGAGDSFGAGFVAGFIQSKSDVIFATQLGIANADSCLKKIGAKNGLLKKNEKFFKVRVTKEKCCSTCLCQRK